MTPKRIRLRPLAACLTLVWVACAYAPVDPRGTLGQDVRTIQLTMFENRSPEVGLEALIGDALQEEFVRRGVLKPVYSQGRGGDIVMNGSVIGVEVRPAAFSSVALSVEDTVEVSYDVSVIRPKDGETLWTSGARTQRERFLASADPQVYESNKEQALRRLAARVASQIHDDLFQTR
jgi:hypothetical protein